MVGKKCFIRVNVKISNLEGPPCWLSTTRKEVGCSLDCCCCPLGWTTWLVGIQVSGVVKMYSFAAGAGCCGC